MDFSIHIVVASFRARNLHVIFSQLANVNLSVFLNRTRRNFRAGSRYVQQLRKNILINFKFRTNYNHLNCEGRRM